MSYRLWEALTVLLTSSIKFLPSPFLSVNVYDFTFWETILMTMIGGVVGTTFFYLISGQLMKRAWDRRMRRAAEGRAPRKRTFRRRNKTIVRVKRKFGLIGLALVTPAIISIPIGAVLAAKYFRKRMETLPFMLFSVVLWSFLLTGIASLLPVSPFPHHK
ncbi:MAG: hypothetical protein ABEH38_05125 [Flavobacteriales bacterium]